MIVPKMLFTPIKINQTEIKNRCLVPAMGANYSNADGTLSDKIIDYYTARARGGFGLVITETVSVTTEGRGSPRQSGLWDDKHVAGWARMAQSLHAYGAKLAPQLYHGGNKTYPRSTPGAEVTGPSPISYVSAGGRNTPIAREMTIEDIERTIEAFGEGARRAREAGCDAVEIHGAHGYLVSQFMSPVENQRIDSYGGNLAGRMKMPLAVVKKVREKVGPDFPIIFRMSVDEMNPGGRTLEESQVMAWMLAQAGVDCLNLSRGSINYSVYWTAPPMDALPATWVTENTWPIKQVVSIPVIAVGRVFDPLMAEFILQTGKADLIAFGRASLTDPELPNKTAAGQLDDIRPCIGCNSCNDSLRTEFGLSCAMNPELGREKEILPLAKAAKKKTVLVAGSGPGGLEAARVAALRGHYVTIYEKENRAGGQLWAAALPPGKHQIANGLQWLLAQAQKAGVRFEMNKPLTPELVDELKPDAVIIATGAAPKIPREIPGIDKPKVVMAIDVLKEKSRCGSRVVILGANMVGCEVADWLGWHGKDITLVKMRPGTEIAEDLSIFRKPFVLGRLDQWKVKTVTGPREGVKIKEITDDGVVIIRDGTEEKIPADHVVLALGVQPVNELADRLKEKAPEIYVVGDAKEPRRVINAVSEGAAAGRQI